MAKKKTTSRAPSKPKPRCGLVMPIAKTPNCSEGHWREVKEIFVEALKSKFETELVSEEPEVGVIQGKIVNNLYDNPLVVVDVSELNANVMFELGLRLAFDKPTVLVKDEETDWKFDISPLETLVYPRDLRHTKILNFQKELAAKAQATYEKGVKEGKDYSVYLKHFKKLERKTIPTEQVGDIELMMAKLNEIQQTIGKPKLKVINSYGIKVKVIDVIGPPGKMAVLSKMLRARNQIFTETKGPSDWKLAGVHIYSDTVLREITTACGDLGLTWKDVTLLP